MKYIFTPTAEDDFDKLTQLNRKRIATKMRFYASQSDPLQFAEPLTGSNEYRFRIGDYFFTGLAAASHRQGASP